MAVNTIGSINPANSVPNTINKTNKNNSQIPKFSDFFNNALNNVNQLKLESNKLTEDFAAGKIEDIHQVLIAAEKADIALQFTMQVRNSIVDAYNEIMRINI